MRFLVALLVAFAAVSINAESFENVPGSASFEKKWVTKELADQTGRDKLLDQLFKDYKPFSYPDNCTIRFGLSLLNVDLDEAANQMKTSVWTRYFWTDHRLAWDEEATEVRVLRIPSSMVWTPTDVTLYNSATQDKRMSCWDSNVLIYSSGEVLWVPPCHFDTFCNLTISHNPYKEQSCDLKFGSWTFDGWTMGLEFYQNETFVNVNDFQGNSRFKITSNKAVRNEKLYDCCDNPYLDLTFTLGLTQIDTTELKCEDKN